SPGDAAGFPQVTVPPWLHRTLIDQDRTRQSKIRIPAGQGSLSLSYLARVSVDHGSPEPAYVQLAEILRGRIAAGEWSRGPLPSNRALQETYDVGEYVVTHAIRLLEDEGLVFTVPRRGTYVRQQGLALAGSCARRNTARPDSN